MTGNFIRCFLSGLAATILSAAPAWAQEKPTTLDAVVVTANRSTETVREVTSNVTVIGEKDLAKSTANTLDQLMKKQGFQVVSQGTQQSVYIRGMGQGLGTELESRVLILVNGRRVGSSNAALIGLNKDSIERIEIIRGPSAIQYGSSALGGVINIITKRNTEGFNAALELGLGSNNLHKESLALNGAQNDFDFALGVTNFGRDDYAIKGGDRWSNTKINSSTNVNADLGYTFLENHRLGLDFTYFNENGAEFPDSGWSGSGPLGTKYNSSDLVNSNLAFTYDGSTQDEVFDWMLRYSFGRNKNSFDPANSTYGGTPYDTILDNKAVTAQTSYHGDITSLTLGFDYLKYNFSDQTTENSSANTGGFLTGKLRLLEERLIFSAGGRFDSFKLKQEGDSKKENNFSPTVGVAVLPVEWLKIRTNYSEGFRMPSPQEYMGSQWYLPNTNLNPEKSKTFEIGADVDYSFFTAGLTFFHTKWQDKIVANPVGSGWDYQFQNLNKATIAGLELALGADIGQVAGWDFELRPYLNLTWLTTRKNGDVAQIKAVGNDILLNTPKYALSYGLDFNHQEYDLMANINAAYFSDSQTLDRRVGSPTKNSYIEEGSGTVVDLSLEKGIYDWEDQGRLKLRAEINNVFDARNESYLDYPGQGRNFYVGVRYEY